MQRDHLDRPRSRSRGSRGAGRSPRRGAARRATPSRPSRRAGRRARLARQRDPARGHLARGPDHRQRALGVQAAGLELGGRAARRSSPPSGESRRPSKRRPERGDHAALDRGRAGHVDQLLGDRPHQGLPRVRLRRTRSHGSRPDRAADHRVVAEARVEVRQVVVDPGRAKRIRAIPSRARRLDGRPRGEHGPGDGDHDRLAVHVQQPHEPVAAPPRQPVQRGGPSRNGAQRGSTTSRTSTSRRGGREERVARAPSQPARPRALSRGAAGGRRPGTSATRRSRRSGPTSCSS